MGRWYDPLLPTKLPTDIFCSTSLVLCSTHNGVCGIVCGAMHQRPSSGYLCMLEPRDRLSLWTKGGRQPAGRSTADWHISTWFLDEKYSSSGICPPLVLLRLCPASLPKQSEAIRLHFLLRRHKLYGWKILLLPEGCFSILSISVSLRPQTGFPRFCYHNTVWLWFLLSALCNHVFRKIEPVLH